MGKLNAFSYLFFFLALLTQVNDYVVEYLIEAPEYWIHHLQLTLLIIAGSPVLGIVFGWYGKRGNHRRIAIALNAGFFLAFGLLALLNFWITTFGIW
jgi:ABC-type proline/glycine betaine transport system permease subunit